MTPDARAAGLGSLQVQGGFRHEVARSCDRVLRADRPRPDRAVDRPRRRSDVLRRPPRHLSHRRRPRACAHGAAGLAAGDRLVRRPGRHDVRPHLREGRGYAVGLGRRWRGARRLSIRERAPQRALAHRRHGELGAHRPHDRCTHVSKGGRRRRGVGRHRASGGVPRDRRPPARAGLERHDTPVARPGRHRGDPREGKDAADPRWDAGSALLTYRTVDDHVHVVRFDGSTLADVDVWKLAKSKVKARGRPTVYVSRSPSTINHVLFRGLDGHVHELGVQRRTDEGVRPRPQQARTRNGQGQQRPDRLGRVCSRASSRPSSCATSTPRAVTPA